MAERERIRPYDELARALLRRDRLAPKLTGSTTAGGDSDQTQDRAWVNPMDGPNQYITSGPGGTPLKGEAGTEGQVMTIVGGALIFADAPSAGAGRYRQYLIAADGAGGWGFVQATSGGQAAPVTALFDLET